MVAAVRDGGPLSRLGFLALVAFGIAFCPLFAGLEFSHVHRPASGRWRTIIPTPVTTGTPIPGIVQSAIPGATTRTAATRMAATGPTRSSA